MSPLGLGCPTAQTFIYFKFCFLAFPIISQQKNSCFLWWLSLLVNTCPNLTARITQKFNLCKQDYHCIIDPAQGCRRHLVNTWGQSFTFQLCTSTAHHQTGWVPIPSPAIRQPGCPSLPVAVEENTSHLPLCSTPPGPWLELNAHAPPIRGRCCLCSRSQHKSKDVLSITFLPRLHPFKVGFKAACGLLAAFSSRHCQGSLPLPQYAMPSAQEAQLDSLSSSNVGIYTILSFVLLKTPISGQSCQMLPAAFLHALIWDAQQALCEQTFTVISSQTITISSEGQRSKQQTDLLWTFLDIFPSSHISSSCSCSPSLPALTLVPDKMLPFICHYYRYVHPFSHSLQHDLICLPPLTWVFKSHGGICISPGCQWAC